ncbi:MAG: metallophosphoesterase [Bacteroidetes bacterium]|nr:metallophosphoesterase [Bacteroidota bacterium]
MRIFLAGLLLLTLLVSACSDNKAPAQKILFLGHPYQWAAEGVRMDFRVEAIDQNQYDKIWLGGDLCAKTTEDPQTLVYLDSLLDLDSPDRHWSLGNHDVMFGKLEKIREATGRNDFYQSWEDGYTLLVLNTNLFSWPEGDVADAACRRMAEQVNFVRSVCDTIQASSHLVVLHHQCLLTDSLAGGTTDLKTVFNYYQPDFSVECDSGATFSKVFYPALKAVQERGIQVLFVGGDMGMRAKKFEHKNPDGIWFLGAGINNSVPDDFRPKYITDFSPDQVLILEYAKREFSWWFEELD